MSEAIPGRPCPTCGQHVPAAIEEPVPGHWVSLTVPDEAPPAVDLADPVPFMRGTSSRWQRDAVRGLGDPARTEHPDGHGLAPVVARIARLNDTKGDSAA